MEVPKIFWPSLYIVNVVYESVVLFFHFGIFLVFDFDFALEQVDLPNSGSFGDKQKKSLPCFAVKLSPSPAPRYANWRLSVLFRLFRLAILPCRAPLANVQTYFLVAPFLDDRRRRNRSNVSRLSLSEAITRVAFPASNYISSPRR